MFLYAVIFCCCVLFVFILFDSNTNKLKNARHYYSLYGVFNLKSLKGSLSLIQSDDKYAQKWCCTWKQSGWELPHSRFFSVFRRDSFERKFSHNHSQLSNNRRTFHRNILWNSSPTLLSPVRIEQHEYSLKLSSSFRIILEKCPVQNFSFWDIRIPLLLHTYAKDSYKMVAINNRDIIKLLR